MKIIGFWQTNPFPEFLWGVLQKKCKHKCFLPLFKPSRPDINVKKAEDDLKEAKSAIRKFPENEKSPERIKALNEMSKAEARIQASKN